MSAADWIAIYAAIVATGALFLELRRWFESGPKIVVRARPGMSLVGLAGIEKKGMLIVNATNRGDAPTTVTTLAVLEYTSLWARWRNRPARSFIIPRPQLEGYPPNLPHVLKIGEQWTGIGNDRTEETGDLQTGKMFAAVYTTDREKPYLARIPKRKPDKLADATKI